MSDVVTGEAVTLELHHARLPSRALAVLLDVTVQVAVLAALVLIAGRLLRDSDEALTAAVQLTITVTVLVGYPVLAETLSSGRSLGKAALGLRVVRDDGGPIRFRQALVRGLLGFFVDLWLTSGIGAIVSTTVSDRGKRVGDVLAGTVVIRERAPASESAVPAMPAGLGSWAAAADLSRLDDRLALSARQVLNRSRQLSPAAYAELCGRIAGAVSAVVSPAPPAGTPPDSYLAALLAERRRRAELRLASSGQPPAAASWSPASEPAIEQPAAEDRTATPSALRGTDGGFTPPG